MHKLAWGFVSTVKAQAPEFFIGKKVLEVGSQDINGSVRDLFDNCDYEGIDLGAGKGVDCVVHVTDLSAVEKYDVVISTEALEHDHLWDKSLAAMYRLLKPNGILIITCAGPDRPEHGTRRTEDWASPHTTDYYRNISVEDFASVLPAELFSKSHLVYCGYEGRENEDLYFVGIKKEGDGKWVEFYKKALEESKQWMETHPSLPSADDVEKDPFGLKIPLTVTAEVCTKDRPTTLPMTISAILNQTHKPQRLVIYNDGAQEKLEETQPIEGLLRMAIDHLGIQWTVYATPQTGQVACHQHAIDDAQTDVIFRVDDDEIPEPNCLENLLAEMKDGVGAVGGLVHHPGGVVPLPDWIDGSLNDVAKGVNMQWYSFNSGPREVSHLYSTFIFRTSVGREVGGYPKELSCIGHREESWFTNKMHRAGYKLIVTPKSRTWHLRQPTGGIRSYTDASMWEHDDLLFQQYLRTVGQVTESEHLVILNSGLGDHLIFKALLVDEFQRKHPERKWLLSVCYPEVFTDVPNVRIISIAEAQLMVGSRETSYNIYDWAWRNNKSGSIVDTMREFYGDMGGVA